MIATTIHVSFSPCPAAESSPPGAVVVVWVSVCGGQLGGSKSPLGPGAVVVVSVTTPSVTGGQAVGSKLVTEEKRSPQKAANSRAATGEDRNFILIKFSSLPIQLLSRTAVRTELSLVSALGLLRRPDWTER